MKSTSILSLLLLPTLTTAFSVTQQIQNAGCSTSSLSMAKGFDDNAKPKKREKSAGQIKREQKSAQYDEIAAQGGQEYSIFVRQFGGEDGSWLPCGAIAVPRNAQVGTALFANEEALKQAIVRQYPKLQGFEQEFEFGCNLKIYPDDPVEVVAKGQGPDAGMSIGNWISNLLSPVDVSKK